MIIQKMNPFYSRSEKCPQLSGHVSHLPLLGLRDWCQFPLDFQTCLHTITLILSVLLSKPTLIDVWISAFIAVPVIVRCTAWRAFAVGTAAGIGVCVSPFCCGASFWWRIAGWRTAVTGSAARNHNNNKEYQTNPACQISTWTVIHT